MKITLYWEYLTIKSMYDALENAGLSKEDVPQYV